MGGFYQGGGAYRRGISIMLVPMPELPFDRVWLPYLYLYGVGGLLFLGGLYLVLRSGALDLKRPRHRRWLGVLLFGFLWYMGLHLIGTLAATSSA